MPLYISIPIKFYNGIVLFLCHNTHIVGLCLQTAVNYLSKATSTRKNQSDRIVNANK